MTFHIEMVNFLGAQETYFFKTSFNELIGTTKYSAVSNCSTGRNRVQGEEIDISNKRT